MEFDYTVTTNKDFESAVLAVQEKTASAGFRVLFVHNVQQTLLEKGYQIEPIKIIEICNAKSAFEALQADIKIGLCLPCKILVYEKDGKTVICGMRPTVLPVFFPKAQLGTMPENVDKIIKNIIDESR